MATGGFLGQARLEIEHKPEGLLPTLYIETSMHQVFGDLRY